METMIQAATQLLDALGEDVRRGYETPLNAIYIMLRARDKAHEAGTMGTPEFAETAQRMAAINNAIVTLIRAAYDARHS